MSIPVPNILPEHSQRRVAAPRFSSQKVSTGVLHDFLLNSQPWSRERIAIPRRLRRILWALMPVQLLWATLLATILTENIACDGVICSVVTLNRHEVVLLACALLCIIGLAVLAPATRGLSWCDGREVVGVIIAAVAGGVTLLGIATLIIGTAIALVVLATFLHGFTGRF
jgi:hypothetical protein